MQVVKLRLNSVSLVKIIHKPGSRYKCTVLYNVQQFLCDTKQTASFTMPGAKQFKNFYMTKSTVLKNPLVNYYVIRGVVSGCVFF